MGSVDGVNMLYGNSDTVPTMLLYVTGSTAMNLQSRSKVVASIMQGLLCAS